MRNVLLLWIAFVGSATAQFNGDLRLVRSGGSTSSFYTSGRLEVYYSGQWGTVCDDGWDSANTRVACRQLGLSTSTTSWTTSSLGGFGSATGRTWLDQVNCIGTESRLTSCSRNPYGVEDCSHSEDVAIYCGTSSSAPSTGDLRLVRNGATSSSYTSGRLEVYYSGQWGTVCDDLWDSANTRVACRQLGLSTSTTSWTTSSRGGFGSATGRTWLDNVNCIGTESRLTSCSRNSFGVENCFHSEDVAIYCGTSSGGSIVSSAVSIGVGVSVSCLVVFVIIPIVICVLIACAASRSSRRTRTTITAVPSTPSTTVVTTSSQQQSAQQSAYPAAGTDLKQAPPPPYEMSAAYPPQAQQGYPQQGYPPQGYPAQGYPEYPPKQEGAYPPQGYPAQGYPPQPPPQGYPAQGYPPQPPPQGYPAQGYPQQGYPAQPEGAYPAQGYPPQP